VDAETGVSLATGRNESRLIDQEAHRSAISLLLPWYPLGFLAALALALYFTPILREAARNFGIVDQPDGRLKTHEKPVAYLGGLAVYLAFLIALGLMPNPFSQKTLGLLLGGSVVLLIGFIDDLKALSPLVKFLGQLLAAFVLIKADIRIQISVLPPFAADLLTVLWVVAVTNAFNIIDVMDGLCAGVGAVCFALLFVMAILNGVTGQQESASIALFIACFAGALTGFLRSNFRPASIYLGDAGSMLIGFFAGSIAMILSYADRNPLALTAPLFLLGIPLFDLALVVVIRLANGKSPFRGSPDHFAVRLRRHGVPVAKVAILAYLGAAGLGLFAIALTEWLGAAESRYAIAAVVVGLALVGWRISRVGRPGAAPQIAESGSP
jgi:UDP-GlcNAc:undecaprenyl-phosphate GlcNAc-1-phosphate transferase